MQYAPELPIDDAPPESGVRVRVRVARAPETAPAPSTRQVLAEVAEEVFFEVWDLSRALAPLSGPWMTVGRGALGGALLAAARIDEPLTRRALRARWPQMVPGFAAMDRLAWLMVDALCGAPAPRRRAAARPRQPIASRSRTNPGSSGSPLTVRAPSISSAAPPGR